MLVFLKGNNQSKPNILFTIHFYCAKNDVFLFGENPKFLPLTFHSHGQLSNAKRLTGLLVSVGTLYYLGNFKICLY